MDAFATLAAQRDPPLDSLALALAAEFRDVDTPAALARLDELSEEVIGATGEDRLGVLARVLGERHGFAGDRMDYDHPDNSMLDLVLARRRGLPITLSVVYVSTARRAGVPLDGVGLAGHYVVGCFASVPPVLLDPFAGGLRIDVPATPDVRPWGAHETALRMLNNLVGSYTRRHDLGRAIRAGEMRLKLPLDGPLREALDAELRSLRARLN